MKRVLTVALCAICVTRFAAKAIVADNIFGAFFSPGMASTNLNQLDTLKLAAKDRAFDFIAGIDYNVAIVPEKYYWLVRVAYGTETFGLEEKPDGAATKTIGEYHNLHYAYFSPLGLVFKTDELGILDLTAFFSMSLFGKVLIKANDNPLDGGCAKFVKTFERLGVDLNFRGGLSYAISPHTNIMLGVEYYLSFMNSISALADAKLTKPTGNVNKFAVFLGLWF